MEQKSGRNASGNVPKLLKKKNQIKMDRALAELIKISYMGSVFFYWKIVV
ncbi:unnamed protein product [marine sediment metagenome]|uniref:Uncharacterized protein n=1 Tax=marine sediment metagenome TaxID=412755 RepID=X0SNH3_9ZZZZ